MHQPRFLVLVARHRHERIQQARLRQGSLPLPRMQIERSALVARVDRGVGLEHIGAPAMALQDIGEGKAGRAGADDRDGGDLRHDGLSLNLIGTYA